MDARATHSPSDPTTVAGSLEWMWMLPEVKARPSLAIEFVNAWRALPTTMSDKQRAVQAAKMMAAYGWGQPDSIDSASVQGSPKTCLHHERRTYNHRTGGQLRVRLLTEVRRLPLVGCAAQYENIAQGATVQ